MRFLDSSVFLHAYLAPRRKLGPHEVRVKRIAKAIVSRVDSGAEDVLTTVVRVAEIVNIVESRLGLQASLQLLARILELDNIVIVGVERRDYEEALGLAGRYAVSVNDAIAYVKMRENGVREVYTFDKHFRNLPGIRVVQE